MMLHLKTFADIANYPTPSDIDAIVTHGYYVFGDGGGAEYRRVAAVPPHPAYAVSATGEYFELMNKHVRPEMYGARGDGVNDHAALMAMADHARARGYLDCVFESGKTYTHENPFFLANIRIIKIEAWGAKLQNIISRSRSVGSVVWGVALTFPGIFDDGGPVLTDYSKMVFGELINSANIGDASIVVSSGTTTISAGNRVLIYGCNQMQLNSYPPCPRVFEFGKVKSVGLGGVIELERPLGNFYDADWPDGIEVQSGGWNYGRPRVISLDRPNFIFMDTLEIYGLESIPDPLWTDTFTDDYFNGLVALACCERCTVRGMKIGGGLWVSMGGTFDLNLTVQPKTAIWGGGGTEVDKVVDKIIWRECKLLGHSTGLACKQEVFIDCEIGPYGYSSGAIKRIDIIGGQFSGGGIGSDEILIGQDMGTETIVLDGVEFKVTDAVHNTLVASRNGDVIVKAVVSPTVLDIGTQAEFEAILFKFPRYENVVFYDSTKTPKFRMTRFPYLSSGRMLIDGIAISPISVNDVLYAPMCKSMVVRYPKYVGPYGPAVQTVGQSYGLPYLTSLREES